MVYNKFTEDFQFNKDILDAFLKSLDSEIIHDQYQFDLKSIGICSDNHHEESMADSQAQRLQSIFIIARSQNFVDSEPHKMLATGQIQWLSL